MRISFTPSNDLYPFTSQWFESPVGRVHYVDEGQGTPIVMLHGNPTWSFLYRNIIIALKDRFRCVAIDYPGFGLSDRPDGYGYTAAEHADVVAALVDKLDLNGMVFLMQDWGGPIGMSVATRAPDRVAGIVAGNTWFWPPTDRLKIRAFSAFMGSRLGQRRILQRNVFVERIIPLVTARRLTEDEMNHYRGAQPTAEARVGVARFPRQLREAGPWLAQLAQDVPTRLGSKPALFVWGKRDITFPPGPMLPRWRAVFKDAPLVELRRAKHYIQEDAPEEIAAAIAGRFG